MASFRENLVKARSHIVFVIALVSAFALIIQFDAIKASKEPVVGRSQYELQLYNLAQKPRLPLQEPTSLRPDQIEWARIAWRYFENNIDPVTGLANSVNGFQSTTMWDTGSFLLGLLSARRLGIIDEQKYRELVTKALSSLASIQLFDGRLPNKSYNTASLEMVDYNNKKSSGIGYSALDLGRLLIALIAIENDDPSLAGGVQAVYSRWDFSGLVRDGVLIGASLENGAFVELQEGRLGYEQYAARGVLALFHDVSVALDPAANLVFETVEKVEVPVDSRTSAQYGALNHTVSEPYVLMALETGLDVTSRVLFEQVYRAQENRYLASGILTAVSEGHLNQKPSFAYASVFAEGAAWAVIDPAGKRIDQLRFLSTKTAFAFNLIFGTEYSRKLLAGVLPLNDPKGGWLEGRYEDGSINDVQTANTNGIILESLAFAAGGAIARPPRT